MEEDMPSNFYDLGHVCEIVGRRIKIEGPAADTGLWMVPVMDSTKAMKIPRIISNSPSRIEFVPVDTGFQENRLEIRTRYTGTATPLLTTRVFTSSFSIHRV
jgi:hypothetical protein